MISVSISQLKLIFLQSVNLTLLIVFGEVYFGLIVLLFSIYVYKVMDEKVLYMGVIFSVTYFHYLLMMSLGMPYEQKNMLIVIISGNIFLYGYMIGSLVVHKKKINSFNLTNRAERLFQNNYCMIFSFILTAIGYWDYLGRGANKREVLEGGGYEYYVVLFLVVLSVVDIFYSKRNKLKLLGYFLCFAGVLLVAGERDILAKWGISIFLIYWLVKKELKRKHMFVIAIGAFLFMVFSHYLKGLANWGGYEITDTGVSLIFDNDLSVSARNFYYILSMNYASLISSEIIINDILRFFGVGGQSATEYFNNAIYNDVGSARGFSFFAQIYFSFGYIGLIVFGYFFGWLSNKYSVRTPNARLFDLIVSWSLLYAFIYGTRSDLANILSIVLKQTLFYFLIIQVVISMVNKSLITNSGEENVWKR